ncbi:S1C family serine protease [Streptomyces sp. O3]
MDEGKPARAKADWWSRPRQGQPGAAAEPSTDQPTDQPTAATEGVTDAPAAEEPATDAATDAGDEAPAPGAERRPLHAPDRYGTPPYGEPGPWAPAPPVQHPRATPAHGTPVPPHAGQPEAGHPPADGLGPHGHPAPPPDPAHPASTPTGGAGMPGAPWQQYDPWSTPRPQPLLPPAGAGSGAPARKRRPGALLVGALAIALLAGAVGGGVGAYVERNGGITDVRLPQADAEDVKRPPESVAGIAASAVPSVVTLHVSGGGAQGTGTGFVLDDKGHILTNNHVVDPAGSDGRITVTFSGGESAKARLIGKDAGYDLAVVRVTGVSGLKPLPLGNSDSVQVGDPVVAIGAPFDLSNTVTSGIISAKGRPITAGGDGSDMSYVDALQTDAPINPGNSGGPLVDSKARVIGINSAIRSAGGGSDPEGGGAPAGSIGLGFAIPVNLAKRVAEELINTGKATHPVIKVTLDTRFTGDGARVADETRDGGPAVEPGGPADQAGVRAGDVITAVNGQRIHTGQELIVKIRAHRPGDKLELTLERDGDKRTLSLELGSADAG